MDDRKDFRRTVLVVDDEKVNQEMLSGILSQSYNVITVQSGSEALALLRERKVKISLILLDLLMPEVDGYEVMKAVSTDPDFGRIPIIVLTSDKSAEIKSLQMGASDFLTKPYDSTEVILARVRHSIALAEDMRLIKSTERDFLTKLYTKEFFYEYANQIKERNPQSVMDSVVLNLTNFHLINEIYGRDFGNILLQTIGDEVVQLAEESHGIGCRDNADGFYLYIEWNSSYDKLLERIQLHLSELLKETEIHVRMGVCRGDFPSVSAQQSFDRALCACNTLRDKFESSFAIYDEKMHNAEIKKARLLSDFADAVEAAYLLLPWHFVDVCVNELVGACAVALQ